jgi:hypothetical protein
MLGRKKLVEKEQSRGGIKRALKLAFQGEERASKASYRQYLGAMTKNGDSV